jgi:flavin reductase (DIM6/NTAB) family NADH-FMN oxidoreductase RutF
MSGTAASDDIAYAFRQAMRRLAATVTIVSTARMGQRSGMTATAVTSLSVQPPALLVCVNRSASLHADLSLGARFCVNILGHAHGELSAAFGGQTEPEGRFAQGAWQDDPWEVPYLSDAPANVFCIVARMIDYGTHSIVIGSVYAAREGEGAHPLIYGNGRYLGLADAS